MSKKSPRKYPKSDPQNSPESKKEKKKHDSGKEDNRSNSKEYGQSQMVNKILGEARMQIGVPYKYGGHSPGEGFDCSGLVHFVFEKAGISLQRASYLQATDGIGIHLQESKPGDLVFFSYSGNKINHVGIVVSESGEPLSMIHASSSKGVVTTNVEASEYWRSRLKGARRVV